MKAEYKKAYDSINVSDELHEMLTDIPNKKSLARNVAFKAAVTIAAAFALIFSTDMISYAVTGEGVAERVQKAVGETDKSEIVIMAQNKRIENFEVYEEGDLLMIEFYDPIYGDVLIIADSSESVIYYGALPPFFVDERDGRVIATVGDNYFHIDITDDMAADGSASGEFEVGGDIYKYHVFLLPEDMRDPVGDKGYRWSIRHKLDYEK